jgi:hypothetical protein
MMADKDRIERDIFYSVLGLYQGRYYQVNRSSRNSSSSSMYTGTKLPLLFLLTRMTSN